jgi:NAD(P)-dependent dehydrogenase (short-subunit alcohol dehydrogenase family)
MSGSSLDGELVLVTGGAQGLGAAKSRVLARAGARVAVTDLRVERADFVAREITASAGNAFALSLDVGDERGLSDALHAELRPHGVRVCAVVAGGMRTPFLLERFPDLDPSKLQDPENVAETIKHVPLQPPGTAIAEVMVLPTQESSWP